MKKLGGAILGTGMLIGGIFGADNAIDPYVDKGVYLETSAVNDLQQTDKIKIDKSTSNITLEKWGGEEAITIIPEGNFLPPDRALLSKTLVSESVDGKSAISIEPTQNKDGINYDIILNEKPSTNVFSQTITGVENLDFYYQPPLWQQAGLPAPTPECSDTDCTVSAGNTFMPEGHTQRPENIVGSYAVYSKTKRDHIEGQTNYATGKLFHIYRPKIIDANNKEVWGELKYKDGTLSVIVPQDFLDAAVYPVKIDPTFGTNTVGGTGNTQGTDTSTCLKTTSPALVATTTNITGYMSTGSGTKPAGMAMYTDSSGDPLTKVAEDIGDNATITTTPAWATTTVYAVFAASTTYHLCEWAQTAGGYSYYSDASAGAELATVGTSWETWTSPAPAGSNFNFITSIYATYSNATISQTHYRFRNDDGSETTATWYGAEDTAITAPNMTNMRIRLQASTTNDIPSRAYQLEYKLSTDTSYKKVGTTTADLAFVASSTPAAGTTSVLVNYPTGLIQGDLLVMGISTKATTTQPVLPSGWTKLANSYGIGGQGSSAVADVGGAGSTVYIREALGNEAGAVPVTVTSGNVAYGQMTAFRKGTGQHWAYEAVTGADNSGGANTWSTATTTNLSVIPNDYIVEVSAINTDAYSYSAQALSMAGATFGTWQEIEDGAGTATGLDTDLNIAWVKVLTGSVSAAPTFTMTASGSATSNPAGSTVMLKIRQVDDDIQLKASANITDTGDATTAQLTVPGGKSFTAGKMNDLLNPAVAVDIATDRYSEFEWNVIATTTVPDGNIYTFRITNSGTGLDYYLVTPKWTIGSGVAATAPSLEPKGKKIINGKVIINGKAIF